MIRCSSLKKSCCCFAAMWNYQEDANLRKKKQHFFLNGFSGTVTSVGSREFTSNMHASVSEVKSALRSLETSKGWMIFTIVLLFVWLFIYFAFFFSLCTVCFRRRKKRTLTFRWFHHDLSEFLAVHPVHLLSMWSILIFVHEQSNLAFSCSISAQYRCLASRNVVNPFTKSPPLLPSLSKMLLCIACSDFRAFV